MSKYRSLFLSETKDHCKNMSRILLALDGGGVDGESINALFREAHSVKGMASSMGYGGMEELAHHIEDDLDRFRRAGSVPPEEIDRLLAGLDLLEGVLEDIEAERPERDIAQYLASSSPSSPDVPPSPPAPKRPDAESVAPLLSDEKDESGFRFRRDDRVGTVRVQTPVLDRFIDLAGELITSRYMLQNAAESRDWDALQRHLEAQGRLIGDLHHQVRQVRLMPLESLTGRLPRLVRDLTRRTGKEIRLQIEGEELELDRSILETLADPLIHLVRNALDHGIAERGTVSVRARREKDQAVIEVADDGRGIDVEEIVRKALERKLITPAVAPSLSKREILQLICAPGFSTAPHLTETSGRGVGMDVVKSALEGMGGRLEIVSERGKGTLFRLQLPLSGAILHLLILECAGQRVGIPFTRVQRLLDVAPGEVRLRDGRASFIFGEEEIPLLSLGRILGVGERRSAARSIPVVLTEIRGRRVGLTVDRTAGGRQAFVKRLSFPLDQWQGVSGSTVLGDGSVVFVIDPQGLLENRFGGRRPSGEKCAQGS